MRFEIPCRSRSAGAGVLALLLGAVLAGCGADQSLPLQNSVVFVVQKPILPTPSLLIPERFQPGGAIYSTFSNFTSLQPETFQPIGSYLARLDPDGSLHTLSPVTGAAARDPEVSYDGKRVIFAMKNAVKATWQIYEVGADGTGLRKISGDDRFNDFEPAYLPDGRIAFLSDRPKLVDPIFHAPSAQLHLMQSDGTGVVQLGSEPGGELNPTVSSDGRLLFTRWNAHYGPQLIDPPTSGFAPPVDRFLVWKTAIDGTSNAHPAFGEHTLPDFTGGFVHVRELTDGSGRLLATLADQYNTFGSGTIVRLDPRQNADVQTIEMLTPDVHGHFDATVAGRYRSPYPLADGRILAVYSSGPVIEQAFLPGPLGFSPTAGASGQASVLDPNQLTPPHFKLVLLPAGGGSQPEDLYDVKDAWIFSPVELAPRKKPSLDPGTARAGFGYAILNSRDVYLRDLDAGKVVNGDEQGVPAPGEAAAIQIFVGDFVTEPWLQAPDLKTVQERFLGSAPVAADGSFAAAVPAGVPLRWQSVRANGTPIVEERFFVEMQPGQVVTCNGCHSPHDGTTGRTTNQALLHPTNLSGQDVDRNHDGKIDLLQ
jgi:hydrazine synthase alpha subunit-like protein/WD40 repeat protein